jgi:flagellar biogenesis protein FliO
MKKKCLLLIFLLLFFVCDKGYCVTDIEERAENQGSVTTELESIGTMLPSNFPEITRLLKSTGIVIVVIVVTVFFLRKKLGIKTGMSGRKRYVHIVDTVPLGSKRYIHLVKVPGKVLLIGATNERIQSLTEIIEKDIVESIDTESKSSEFMRFFKRAYTERT